MPHYTLVFPKELDVMKRLTIGLVLMLLTIGCLGIGLLAAAQQTNSRFQDSSNDAQSNSQTSGSRPRRGRPQEAAAPGKFDFYLLTLSWSPEFCATHSDSSECGHGLGFVVHGMWPQNTNGSYPQHCSNAPGPTDPQADTDIIPTVSLVEHEWQTHGTCSGLAADDYFTQIHKAFAAVKIPTTIGTGKDPDGVAPGDLLARFASANPSYPAGGFALSCGNNRLTAVEICLTKDLSPEACQGVRSCRANVVKVTPK
jgi:ribonuclease T2